MREGMYLGAPPVDVRAVGSRRLQHSLMRGVSSYAGAAGGFDQVPAFPPLQHFKPPASANAPADIRMVELYADHPGLFKQKLAAQFRVPRSRVTSGTLRTTIPELGVDGA